MPSEADPEHRRPRDRGHVGPRQQERDERGEAEHEAARERRHALGEGERGQFPRRRVAEVEGAPGVVAEAAGGGEAERVAAEDGRERLGKPDARRDPPHEPVPAVRFEPDVRGH